MWLNCGADAPIDFILVVRSANVYRIRFMDAKHRTSTKSGIPRKDIMKKAAKVHSTMAKGISKLLGQPTETFCRKHVLLTTNRRTKSAGVLSPTTFCWHPWSHFAFGEFSGW